MTWRMRLADWISGGKLTQIASAYVEEEERSADLFIKVLGYRRTLRAIIANPEQAEQIAREALGE